MTWDQSCFPLQLNDLTIFVLKVEKKLFLGVITAARTENKANYVS